MSDSFGDAKSDSKALVSYSPLLPRHSSVTIKMINNHEEDKSSPVPSSSATTDSSNKFSFFGSGTKLVSRSVFGYNLSNDGAGTGMSSCVEQSNVGGRLISTALEPEKLLPGVLMVTKYSEVYETLFKLGCIEESR